MQRSNRPELPAVFRSFYARYRAWEDGYIDMLADLNAGREPGPHWSSSAYRRLVVQRMRRLSPMERHQYGEFIYRYRGWRGWLWLLGLVAFNCLLGLALHLVRPTRLDLVEAMVTTNLALGSMVLSMLAVWYTPRVYSRRWLRFTVTAAILALAGALAGAGVAALTNGETLGQMWDRVGRVVTLAGLGVGGVYAALCAVVVTIRLRGLQALNAELLAQAERERLANQAAEARLRLLQAQIEPHFLFNTLGAVQQLAERRAPEAAALAGHLIRFLRSSMSSFRDQASTLGNELALAESYLQVMASRLGPRLVHHIKAPAELLDCPMRPTLLITLVENAVKHGIEPAPSGGQIVVTVQREPADGTAGPGRLVIEVADTGVGMAELPGHGDGLSNLRSQLALAHGDQAALELLDNEPQGLVARLVLPLGLPPDLPVGLPVDAGGAPAAAAAPQLPGSPPGTATGWPPAYAAAPTSPPTTAIERLRAAPAGLTLPEQPPPSSPRTPSLEQRA